ncbi:MAG TPA: glycerophosphodiester phosphodiesterase family protein [Prolixibacteraceae bacterium]|jgi:glycerophosphoryl diester phosphodiesterase
MIATPGHLNRKSFPLGQKPFLLLVRGLLVLILAFATLETEAQCNFKTIGHRGGSSFYYPENTLVSLEQGFIADVYAAEIDVRFTSDGVLVLMHDSYIDRTTNGTGEVSELTLSYIKSLDAGRWKGSQFAGTPVPTLKEALELANRFHKKLYLNMKVFAPELIAKTLIEANVPSDIVMLDPDDLDKVVTYHQIMPNTPLVYFGDLPANIEDPTFYNLLKNNGVIAIEIPADYIRYATDDTYTKLRDIGHSYNLQLWAYTVNDAPYFRILKDFGIEGLETDRPTAATQVFCNDGLGGYFPEKRVTGQWDFNQDLTGTIGSKLGVVGDATVTGQQITFGTTQSFGLPAIESTAVNVARIPAFDSKHALRFFSNIAPEGLPGVLDCDNTYTLVFDLLKPAGENAYTAILQTSNNNSDDADLFLKGSSNSFGVLEQYKGSFKDSTWVRMALVFDLYKERMDEYLDGNYVGTITLDDSKNGRFCINNNWGVQSSNFFSDNDGETNPLFVSSIQLRNYAMTVDEIKLLGNSKASKIDRTVWPDVNSSCPEFTNPIQLTTDVEGIHLLAQAGEQVNYQWEMNSGSGWQTISGTAFKSIVSTLTILNHPELLDGYKFRCTAFNDCRTTSDEYLFKDITANKELTAVQDPSFIVYPNPSTQSVTIDFFQSSLKYDIGIYSILGIEVYSQPSVVGQCKVNLSKGTYLVKVTNGQKSEYKKLVIKD